MSGVQSQSMRTYTVRENGVVKTITERTVTTADGKTTTYREEKTEGAASDGGMPSGFGNLSSGFENFGNNRDAFMSRFSEMGGNSIQDGGSNSKPSCGSSWSTGPTPSTPSGGGSSGPVDLGEFREQTLKAHNERRKRHGVPALKLSSELNNYAQNWADHLVKTNSFQHSNCQLNSERLGENIANKWSSAGADYTGEEVTEQWYSEISKHDYNSERSMGTGHFTQVVWKDSTELGVGKAKSSDGKVIVVGSYKPAGNFIGNFTKNVFPPK